MCLPQNRQRREARTKTNHGEIFKMPLIIIVGCPASGKSTRAKQLKEFFEIQKEKTAHVVSENEIVKSSVRTCSSPHLFNFMLLLAGNAQK